MAAVVKMTAVGEPSIHVRNVRDKINYVGPLRLQYKYDCAVWTLNSYARIHGLR